MGWGTFLIAYVVLAATLICPGYLVLRGFHASRGEALCVAPAITIASFVVLGIAYARLGLPGNYYTVALVPTLAFLVFCLLRRPWRKSVSGRGHSSWLAILIYLVVGITMTFLFFAGNLEGQLGSFQPDNDNAYHLSLIKSIATSGDYSILSASAYRASNPAPFTGGGSFYPAAFHLVAASVVNLLGLGIPLAENAFSAVIISLVWPLGVYWMLSHVVRKDQVALFAGALACMTIIAFPWRFFAWGPLFPNLLSLSLVPGAIGTFMECFDPLVETPHKASMAQLLLFISTMCAIAASHPNGVFTLGVLLVPYMVNLVWHARGGRHMAGTRVGRYIAKLALSLVLLMLVAGIWFLAYSLPALQSVVGFVWDPYEDFGLGILGALTLKTAGNRAQSLLAILLIVGLVCCLYRWRDYAWLFALFAFVTLQFAVSASMSGPVKQVLCGFWYGDPNRLAANLGIAAVPIVAIGMSTTLNGISRMLKASTHPSPATTVGLVLAILVVIVSTSVLGHAAEEEKGFQFSTTASFDYSSLLEYKYSSSTAKGYDAKEQAFVDKALALVPEGSLILNVPNDGSCFAYSVQNANVFYKDVTSPSIESQNQTQEAKIIRRNLYNLATYQSVQDAARELDAHYLLLLDQGQGQQDDGKTLPLYQSWEWRGMVSVNDETPGFEVVLAQDDMRLYRLVY